MPRFDQSFSGICEQNLQDTLQLKQRYLDSKAKRLPKGKDKKQQDQTGASIQSSVHVQQKFLKRAPSPSLSGSGGGGGDPSGEGYEPPMKLQCTAQPSAEGAGLTKFSVEIVQQLEFTTSAASSQPQQISTNVTVKAHANTTQLQTDETKGPVPTQGSGQQQQAPSSKQVGLEMASLVECKQEPENDFADLDQCAAALEKDAQVNGGSGFGGFNDLITEESGDEIMTTETFNNLISDITNCNDFIGFDFEEKPDGSLKVEDPQPQDTHHHPDTSKTAPQLTPAPHSYSNSPTAQLTNQRMSYASPSMDLVKTELSPAAQTLKQMAEQHQQQKNSQIAYSRTPNARSPYTEFPLEYGSPGSGFKGSPGAFGGDGIKQEMIYQSSDYDMKSRKPPTPLYTKQQPYSPYSSPNPGSHGSPGYLPPRGQGAQPGGPYGGGTPPRPSSGHGGGQGQQGATLHINQAQQLHVSQQGPHGTNIQVSAGQQLHLSGDLKSGNVSLSAHQGMHFNNHSSNSSQSSNQSNTNQQTPNQQPSPMGANMSSMGNNMSSMGPNMSSMGGPMTSMGGTMTSMGGPMTSMGGPMTSMGGTMTSMGGGPMTSMAQQQANMMSQGGGQMHGGQQPGMGGLIGNGGGVMGGQGGAMPGESYGVTQAGFRQRVAAGAGGMPTSMSGTPLNPTIPLPPGAGGQGPINPLMQGMSPAMRGAVEQQKLLQMRGMMAAGRPPPPEYKASGLMQQRYQGQPQAPQMAPQQGIRRMPCQPMPPSGPMIRSHNMYMMQGHHITGRTAAGMYQPRQQGPMSGMEPGGMPQHGSPEWRQLMLSQQQAQQPGFNPQQMQQRTAFQQAGFAGMGGTVSQLPQMSALQQQQQQQQQMRNQQMISSNAMGQQGMGGQVMNQGGNPGPMQQMNSMNQHILSQMQHQQQQQSLMQQSNQMSSLSSLHLHQSQSLSAQNQNLQSSMNPTNQLMNANSMTNQSTSFLDNLDFLDNLGTSDGSGAFTDQDLLNSFDADSGFNIGF